MANQVVLQLDPSPRHSRNSEGSFVALEGGRILFAYTKFGRDSADHGSAVIASRSSDDGGRTWSKRDAVLVPQEGDTNVMSVSLLRLRDGRIALVNLRKDHAGAEQTCMPWIRFSDDEGRAFSEPAAITPVPGYYVVNNDRMIQLRDGRLLVPAGMHRHRVGSRPVEGKPQPPFLAGGSLILFFHSDDGGRTWYESLTNYYECFPNGSGLQEPGVVELRDGRVWSWCRASSHGIEDTHAFQWESYSSDGGMNWESARPAKAFRSPCSPMSVKRIPQTGDLLAVWNDHGGLAPGARKRRPGDSSWGRTPLVTAVSGDEGKTWRRHRAIEKSPRNGYCYTAIYFTDDAVLLAYCAGGASEGSGRTPNSRMVLDTLRVRRMTINELYR